MLFRLRASIVKELLSVIRDPRSRMMVTMAPLMQVLIFTFAATMEVRHVQMAVVNEDAGRWSYELIQRVSSAYFVQSVVHVSDVAQLHEKIANREVLVGIHFPPDFSRDIAAGANGKVQFIIDGRSANAGQITLSYLNEIAAQLGIELQQQRTPQARPPRAEVRHWYNPNLEYRWFIVPSLGASLAMIISLMLSTLSISRERELGTYDQLLVSPTTALEIIASKTVPGILFGFLLSCVVFLMAVLLFGVPFVGNLSLLLLGLFCFLLSISGIGLTISSICYSQQQAMMGLFFAMVPLMLISGFITPVENMPQWLQYFAELSPLKHFIILIQGAFLKAMTPAEMMDNIWPLIMIGGGTLTIATLFVKARME